MYIDFNQIARIAKTVALLGFFLPWVTVSCSGTEMLAATGWQLMTGDPQPAGPFAGMDDERRVEDAEPAPYVVAAFAVVLIGLAAGVLTRARTAAAAMLAAAVLGIALSHFSIQNMRSEMRREIDSAQEDRLSPEDNPFLSAEQQRDLGDAVASSVRVEEEEGYRLTLGALALAAVFSLLTLMRQPALAAPKPPD